MKRMGADDRVTSVRGLQTALQASLSEIASDAAHIPSDMRLQPMAAKPGQMDITTSQVFLKQPQRFKEISQLLKTRMGVNPCRWCSIPCIGVENVCGVGVHEPNLAAATRVE
jgi:hypothetical protein